MNRRLISKLALQDMQKSKKTLIPFLVANAMTVMVFYILYSLAYCPYIYYEKKEAFYGAATIAMLLKLGGKIVAVFALIFILYANNFVMKSKKREIGLYGILGLSKKNIAALLTLETLINALITIVAGIVAGTLLNKLMLLLLYKIIGQAAINGLFVSYTAFANTVVLFGIINLICLVYNVFSTSIGNPIELLRSEKAGEKEPKVNWISLVLGIVALAAGYYIAVSVKTTMEAINTLFTAVILVLAGTYFLFMAGSIFLLKVLKNNKKYYYKTKHFISVSNLIYRMKHNAAGLASICILSTGVILLMTCASSLLALGEKNLDDMFPRDVKVLTYGDDKASQLELLLAAGNEAKADIMEPVAYRYRSSSIKKNDNGIEKIDSFNLSSFDDMGQAYFYTLEEYKEHFATDVTLSEDEILLYTTDGVARESFQVGNSSFKVAGQINYDAIEDTTDSTMMLFEGYYFVFSNEEVMQKAFSEIALDPSMTEYTYILIGFNTVDELNNEQMGIIRGSFSGEEYMLSFKAEDRAFFYNTYGGVFFVGIFLAILFLGATVLIIYYKQMSEGFEDQRRYLILKNVGLTDEEVRATIKSQVMLIFFLPVITAIIHMFFASNIVRVFLGLILLVDSFTFTMAILAVDAVFLIIYAIVYKITSVEYYKIVNAIN